MEFDFGNGESFPLSLLDRGKVAKALNAKLTPRGPAEIRRVIEHEVKKKRATYAYDAWHFLATGNNEVARKNPDGIWEFSEGDSSLSPYGGSWNRTYNPNPYPGAKPKDIDLYEGTGVGLLYRIQGADHMAWSLAGWSLSRIEGGKVRSLASEQRARRKG